MSPLLASHMRRRLLLSGLGVVLQGHTRAAQPDAEQKRNVRAGPERAAIVFPRDFGSHPDLRTEWWYITGQTHIGTGTEVGPLGFQITFFRARVDGTQTMRSRFAAKQLLFAHAAVTDVRAQRFRHDQRIARDGFGIASASETDTAIRLRDWSLVRQNGVYRAEAHAPDFTLRLDFSETQPVLLQGRAGLSRKGPDPAQTSFYYSQPQLAFEGEILLSGQRFAVSGQGARSANAEFKPGAGAAWLDHEWSESLMPADAVGWDWIGMNLFDGSALMAFQMRDQAGHPIWDAGSFRGGEGAAHGSATAFARSEVAFQPIRLWKSPLTQASYPVEWLLRTPAGEYKVKALLDPQELDSRGSTGAVYWEGLSDLFDAAGRHVGRGYLEMTGYARALVL
ncbi:MAG: carotenoid 1,2-hydratase [Burkholderiaceae bacterium]